LSRAGLGRTSEKWPDSGFAGAEIWHNPNYTVSQKNCAKLLLSELCQISTNGENFWHNDGKQYKLMCSSLIFHLTESMSMHYHVKQVLQIVT